ncbi:regulatory protein ICP22 [Falconid herpesvirus 1]|uniref:Regulatory protein ICP22 n=1 Tax=Falconid herpesvirus 1 TaxID=1510155 RepID=A0A068ES90_9ALPH|nr:regulatory protein ICP22 [Falconid herpesvirus 1]YP_009046599.1 regulatory protein ICP22 [Falconid herpesvirus 1]AID52791.1 regulatory protein ICP22 [Falconid herpesvirus 1]AID52805.1 regulatory protein ICP22 [Falconid herpesvirus 1]
MRAVGTTPVDGAVPKDATETGTPTAQASQSFGVVTAAAASTSATAPVPQTRKPNRRVLRPPRRRLCDGGRPLEAVFTVNHREFGPPVNASDVIGATGPGAFCSPPWTPDLRRMAADVNELFRCILASGLAPCRRFAILRRILLDFHMLGRMGWRLPREVWETVLQLSDGQSGPLRATLRDAEARSPRAFPERYVQGPYPRRPTESYGEECEVSNDDYEDDESTDEDSQGDVDGSVSETSSDDDDAADVDDATEGPAAALAPISGSSSDSEDDRSVERRRRRREVSRQRAAAASPTPAFPESHTRYGETPLTKRPRI